jgi:hypothetical protein
MGEWLPTPPNGHPSGRLPDEFLAENPRAQYDHTVSDWERKFSDPNVVKLRSQLKSQMWRDRGHCAGMSKQDIPVCVSR